MKLYNTMSREVEQLQPLEPNRIKLYTCGLTVYAHPHIGNWLGYIYWDVLVRTLRARGYSVDHTQNITDVGHLISDDDDGEDKMEKGAREQGTTAWDVAEKFTKVADYEAYDLLGLLRPANLISATSYIEQQVELARQLNAKGYLYRTNDGMYFDTSKLDDYGKLAKLDIDGLKAGARVSSADKRNSTDFAVWKFSPVDNKRDMEWDSPWGVGFPGWHLECSAIAKSTLGDQIDIHCGGIDHVPVHHTNEIAQTESLTGKPFSKYWLHNNHIKVDGKKMSKSLGNTYTLEDIQERGFDIDAYKLLVLSKHYQTEGNFTWEILQSAQNRLNNWQSVAALRHQTENALGSEKSNSIDKDNGSLLETNQSILDALSDNLDTPKALTIIDEAFTQIENKSLNDINGPALLQLLQAIDNLLGIRLIDSTPDITDKQKQLIALREKARDATDWQRSDVLRDELQTTGVQVRDTPTGTVWSYAPK